METIHLLAIEEGKTQRKRLVNCVERAINSDLGIAYPHTYIYSPPGLGKTYMVNKYLKEKEINYYEISGALSMYVFGINLATIKFRHPEEKVVIVVDDCDALFKNEESINIMKNVLSGNKCYTYQKNIAPQMNQLTEFQSNAVSNFLIGDQIGFRVPTDNLVFIFTSNFKLPTDLEAFGLNAKRAVSNRKLHLNAIRSRCNTVDFELNKIQHFGWIGDVVLNDFSELNSNHKEEILIWLWMNWDRLNERSIRTIEKMMQIIDLNQGEYQSLWSIDFLNNSELWN
jgi:hypothetical protein